MIDPKLLKEITDAHSNAQLGYGAVNHPTYVKHVGALLREREQMEEVIRDGRAFQEEIWGTLCPDAGPCDCKALQEKAIEVVAQLAAANVRIVELEAAAPAD